MRRAILLLCLGLAGCGNTLARIPAHAHILGHHAFLADPGYANLASLLCGQTYNGEGRYKSDAVPSGTVIQCEGGEDAGWSRR